MQHYRTNPLSAPIPLKNIKFVAKILYSCHKLTIFWSLVFKLTKDTCQGEKKCNVRFIMKRHFFMKICRVLQLWYNRRKRGPERKKSAQATLRDGHTLGACYNIFCQTRHFYYQNPFRIYTLVFMLTPLTSTLVCVRKFCYPLIDAMAISKMIFSPNHLSVKTL